MNRKQAALLFAVILTFTITPLFASEGREKYNFNLDWRFLKGDIPTAYQVDFDDSRWSYVSCPHTFNEEDTFDDMSIGKHIGELSQWRGTVWYRKEFKLPEADQGKRIYIEFEGVRQIADVYINGKHIGMNQTGFIPFGYDLTAHLKAGEENIIAVRVNNDRVEHFRDNLPLVWHHEHWHPNGGGIYRNVYLYAMDPLHITLPIYDNLKTTGSYIYTDKVSEKSADVYVESQIENQYAESKKFSYEVQIIDAQKNIIEQSVQHANLEAGARATLESKLKIKRPELWSTRYPYLYSVVTSIKIDDKVVDSAESSLGIRYFEFNADTGFWINGVSVKLHGWGQKPTGEWAGLGTATPDWMRDYTYSLMDEAGGNFVRWGHCAPSPVEIELGNQYGFATMMPGVAGESTDEGETWDIRLAAFRDMVIQYRNHPTIFIWEGGNWAETEEHYQQMLDIIEEYDPKGLRLYGHRRSDLHTFSDKYVTIEIGTEGWEREFEKLPLIESEYCRDEGPRRSWDRYTEDDNYLTHDNVKKNTYVETSEEFAIKQVDHWWNKMGKKQYHCGGANWVFSDGPHGGRCPTDVTRASGEVDGVRLRKEAFFALKSMWRTEPQAHIIGHWNYDKSVDKSVYVVSNCAAVKLYVNDKLVGENNEAKWGYLFEFPNIKWEEGEIRAEAYVDNKMVVSQKKITVGEPAELRLTARYGPDGWLADGSDVLLIDIETVDALGNRCILDKERIDFTVSGPAIWRGGYNSGSPNSINNQYLYQECGINRVALRSLLQSGDVTITATRVGMKPIQITVSSNQVDLRDGLSTHLPATFSKELVKEPAPIYTPYIEPYIPGVSNKSKLFTRFSYSGESPVIMRTTLDWGKKAYTDLNFNYTNIPNYLRGAEYLRMPDSDKGYWAHDQLQFIAGEDMDIYVCHDDRVACPDFIKRSYTDTGDNLELGGVVMSVYKYQAKKGESIFMAGNCDGDSPEHSRMYLVIGVLRK